MNTLLTYLVYFVTIAVPAGLFCAVVIAVIRRVQMNFRPVFSGVLVRYSEAVACMPVKANMSDEELERHIHDEVERRFQDRLKAAGMMHSDG
jgi:hypothetical protein